MEVQLSLTVNNNLLNKINIISKEMNIDRNEFVIKALKKYLLINEINKIRKKLKPIIKEQGFNTEDDILKVVS